MITKEDLAFRKDIYEKSQRVFQAVEDHLGISLFVHTEDATLEHGQIFLFNHFARFETMIPAYIFYKRFDKFTRTIADHHLFNINPRLDSFLCGAGAVPNNLPGLLPFLAAELLKGHKVAIFPEGAMIKNREVMDNEGRFRIFSAKKNAYRKHHKGAAVLALTLELFKRRINDLFDKGDLVRLDHWTEALELKNHAELKEKIEKPTLIVPSTITFNPIRIGGNFLSKTLNFFKQDSSERLMEELIVEGNIVLKDTDMDIRFGKPIRSRPTWRWWGKQVLNRYFLSIHSLEELFSLKDRAESWSERFLIRFINRETNRIRDEYMRALYQGLTVNTSHIASVLTLAYLENDETEIKQDEFHQALYLSVKFLQQAPDIHLNYNLSKPENYKFLSRGLSPEFEQFLKTALRAELITITEDSYQLNNKLSKEYSAHEVRLENPILVSANEAEPVSEINSAVSKAIDKAKLGDSLNISSQMWDDELRSFEWNTEKYQRPQYHQINQYETAYKDSEPYLLATKKKSAIGVLLVHGFLASPAELSDYGEHIHHLGFNVLGVRLSGHGTSPCDLNTRKWEEWLESVRRGYEILNSFADEIIIVGFSAGGSLALLFAAEAPNNLKGVVSVCAALEVRDKGIHFAPLMDTINKIAKYLPTIDGVMNYKKSDTEHDDTNYQSMPIRALRELKQLMQTTKNNLSKVTAPTLIIQSNNDSVVEPDSANIIMDSIESAEKNLEWIESDSHNILRHNIKGTWSLVDNFITKKVAKT